METRPISTCQLEHALPILAELDLEPVFEAMAAILPKATPQPEGTVKGIPPTDAAPAEASAGILQRILTDGQIRIAQELLPKAMPIIRSLGQAGQIKALRRLGAVATATDDELLAAEAYPAKQKELEHAAARQPIMDNLMAAFGFFVRLGFSASPSPVSSEAEGSAQAEGGPSQEADSPSAGS